MAHVHSGPRWDRRGRRMPPPLPESAFLDRRRLLALLGFGSGLALTRGVAAQEGSAAPAVPPLYQASPRWVPKWAPPGGAELYPAARHPGFALERAPTPEDVAARHNNFYEFLPGRGGAVHLAVGDFQARPWALAVGGEVEEEREVELDELARIAPLEERLYRFRCVEAWSMVVPWTGIPLARFVAWCRPKASARFVRFVSFGEADLDAQQRQHAPPGFTSAKHYPWPYYEGLRLDEALHPLAMLVTGIYGHGLPMQHGAPLRVIVPWKYGYKSAKSLRRVEFTREQPRTFWNDLQPKEYGFLSNVEPDVPHPRWSQASERDLATGDRIPTLPFNGYAEQVAELYR